MFVFKTTLSIIVLLCVSEAAIYPPAENIVQCLVTDTYTLIYNETLHADAIKDDKAALIVNFSSENKNNQVINCVKFTNLNPGDGAEVKTMMGGFSSRVLIAIITSSIGKPVDYSVEIFTE